MGQRANLVVLRDGAWHLYYDHRCANRLDDELFWGPLLATEFVEQTPPDGDTWLDEVWCEGAAVIDHDRKYLGWYGGEDVLFDIPLRRAFLELMQYQWPGWRIEWFAGGVVDLGEYIGISTERFRSPRHSNRQTGITVLPDRDYNNTLLSVQMPTGTSAARVWGGIHSLQLGSGQLPALLAIERQRRLDWAGDTPRFGVHLDMNQRALAFWSARPHEFALERVARTWPEWQVRWLRDDLDEHLRLVGPDVRLPVCSKLEMQRQMIERLRLWGHRPVGSRGSVGSANEKLRVLDDLLRALG